MTSMRDFFLYFKTFEIQFNCVGWIFLFYIALELFVALLRGSVLASLVAVLGSNINSHKILLPDFGALW